MVERWKVPGCVSAFCVSSLSFAFSARICRLRVASASCVSFRGAPPLDRLVLMVQLPARCPCDDVSYIYSCVYALALNSDSDTVRAKDRDAVGSQLIVHWTMAAILCHQSEVFRQHYATSYCPVSAMEHK